MPICASIVFSIPSGLYICIQRFETTARDITTGMKNATLKYFLQTVALFIRSASPSAPNVCAGTIISTNFTVFQNAVVKSSSLKMSE